EMVDELPTVRLHAVVIAVFLRRRAERRSPVAPSREIERVRQRVAGLVAEELHRLLGAAAALDVEHHAALELPEPPVRQVERDRDRVLAVRREPLVAEIGGRAQQQPAGGELGMEARDAGGERRLLELEAEVAEAELEERLVREIGPGRPRRALAHPPRSNR